MYCVVNGSGLEKTFYIVDGGLRKGEADIDFEGKVEMS